MQTSTLLSSFTAKIASLVKRVADAVSPPTEFLEPDPRVPVCRRRFPGEEVDELLFTSDYGLHVDSDDVLRNIEGQEVLQGARVYSAGTYVARDMSAGCNVLYERVEIAFGGLRVPAFRKAGLNGGYPLVQDLQRKIARYNGEVVNRG